MHDTIDWLVKGVEITGAALVVAGVAISVFRILRVPFMQRRPPLAAMQIRLGLGMFLALGLEFQLASDILRTAVAPSFQEIGQLAAVAGIRTALNYFLGREFVEGQRQIEAITAAHLDTRTSGPPAPPRSGHLPVIGSAPSSTPPTDTATTRTEAPRRRPLGTTLRAALKGPLWIPELPNNAIPCNEVAAAAQDPAPPDLVE